MTLFQVAVEFEQKWVVDRDRQPNSRVLTVPIQVDIREEFLDVIPEIKR
jgi:hypothetical protein